MSRNAIKQIAKKFYFGSSKVAESCVGLLSCLLFSSFSAARKLRKMHKEFGTQNKDCFILGNGPALRDALDSLPDKTKTDFFVVNMFANQDVFFELKPNNYIIVDTGVWNKLTHSAFAESSSFEKFKENMEKLQKAFGRVDWNMNLFVPVSCPAWFLECVSPSINVIRINTTPIEGINAIKHFAYKKGWGMPTPINVTNAAIYIGIMLQYPRIYLYGANHSWMCDFRVDENNRIYTEDSHFYKNAGPRYYVKKGALEQSLRSMATAFASHTALEDFSRIMGVRVYNRTKGSFIDAYEFDIK